MAVQRQQHQTSQTSKETNQIVTFIWNRILMFLILFLEHKIARPQRFKLNVLKLRRRIMTPNEWNEMSNISVFLLRTSPYFSSELTHPLGDRNGNGVRGENSPTASSYYFVFLWNIYLISLRIMRNAWGRSSVRMVRMPLGNYWNFWNPYHVWSERNECDAFWFDAYRPM